MQNQKQEKLERVVVDISRRFGNKTIRSAIELMDRDLSALDPKKYNTIHPFSWFKGADS